MRDIISHIFPKSHPIDSSMRLPIATALRGARRQMPVVMFEHPAKYRNECVRDIAGQVVLKVMRREGRRFGIED